MGKYYYPYNIGTDRVPQSLYAPHPQARRKQNRKEILGNEELLMHFLNKVVSPEFIKNRENTTVNSCRIPFLADSGLDLAYTELP